MQVETWPRDLKMYGLFRKCGAPWPGHVTLWAGILKGEASWLGGAGQ